MTRTPSDLWSDDRVQELTRLWEAGLSASQIAGQLGVSRNAVLGKRQRLGLPERLREAPAKTHKAKRAYRRRYPAIRYREPSFPKAPVREVPKTLDFLSIALPDLQPGQCRFPHGDGPFVFCGQPATPGSSYCEHHHSICYGRTPSRFVPVKRNVHAANWRAA